MAFCPKCRWEYIEGVDKCPECGAALMEQLPPEVHVAPRPESPLVKVAEGLRPMVEMLRDILRERGIHSMVRPTGLAWAMEWPPVSPNAEILVRSDDLERNADFIKEEAERFGNHVIWFPGHRSQ